MIGEKSVLAIIPARGGSKGVPRKNIKNLAGKPLIAWTIEAAKKSKYIDRLVLSSEDDEIIQIAKMWECDVPFVRPIDLAQDDTPGIEPVLHAINALTNEYEYIVLLQPTSPLRNVTDIDGCIECCFMQKAPACVSLVEPSKSPFWMYSMDANNRIFQLLKGDFQRIRRQDLPKAYALNGAVYVAEKDFLLQHKQFVNGQTVGFIMPPERSIDIDTELDWAMIEFFLAKKR